MILIIDHYDSFIFNIIDIVKNYGHEVHHAFYDQITIQDIEALNPKKIILSPGPKHPDDAPETLEMIKYFAEKNIPILGICLGHQLIGRAFGAKIEKSEPAHGVQGKALHTRQGLFKGMDLLLKVGRYHSLSISPADFPEDELDLRSYLGSENLDEFIIMAIQHKKYPVYGLQFHPESILTPDGKEIILNFLNI